MDFELIVVVDKKKKGAPWARNQGLRRANGEYILFLDDDIELDPTFLEKMIKTLETNPEKSFAYCHYNRKGYFDCPQTAQPWNLELLKKQNYISTMSLIRTKDCPEWDESLKRFQDWDLWLTMAEDGKEGILVDEHLFTAHYDGNGISNKDMDDIVRNIQIVKDKHGL